MSEADLASGPRTTVAGTGPVPLAAPDLKDPTGERRARLRALVAEAVRRADPIEDARRPLESIVEVSVRLRGEPPADELVVVDEGGAPRTRPSPEGPVPFTVADLLGDLRAVHPTLFRRDGSLGAADAVAEPPPPAPRDWLRLDASPAPSAPDPTPESAPGSAPPGPPPKFGEADWAGSLASAFRSQVEAVRARAPGGFAVREMLRERGEALRSGIGTRRQHAGEAIGARLREAGDRLRAMGERGSAAFSGLRERVGARSADASSKPETGPVPPVGPDLRREPRGFAALPSRPALALGAVAAGILVIALAVAGVRGSGPADPGAQARAEASRAAGANGAGAKGAPDRAAATGSVDAPPRVIDGALKGVPEVVDTATLNFDGRVARLFGVEWARGAGEPDELRSYLAGREVTCLPTTVAGKYRCSVNGQDLSRVVLYNGGGRTTVEASPELKAAEERARQGKAGIWGRQP